MSLLNLDELPMILEKVPDVPGLVYAHVSERFTLGLSGRLQGFFSELSSVPDKPSWTNTFV